MERKKKSFIIYLSYSSFRKRVIQIVKDKLMKLFSLKNQAQITYRVSLWHLIIMIFLSNFPHQKLLEIALNTKLNFNGNADKKNSKTQQNNRSY